MRGAQRAIRGAIQARKLGPRAASVAANLVAFARVAGDPPRDRAEYDANAREEGPEPREAFGVAELNRVADLAERCETGERNTEAHHSENRREEGRELGGDFHGLTPLFKLHVLLS